MAAQRENKLLIYAACAVAAIFCLSGYNSYKTITGKNNDQVDAREKFNRYVNLYKTLIPTKERFNQIFREASSIQDIHSVYKLVNIEHYGLTGSPDKMAIKKVEHVQVNGLDIGLIRICPRAGHSEGFAVSAGSTSQVISGIESLAERPDIDLEYVSIKQTDGKIEAVLGLCLLAKDD